MTKESLAQRLTTLRQQHASLLANVHAHEGAIQLCEELLQETTESKSVLSFSTVPTTTETTALPKEAHGS